MPINKVQLVLPPYDNSSLMMSRTGIYPPLSLLTLSEYVTNHIPNIEIEILDGTILSLNQILKKLDGDLVGLSPTIVTYESALRIAQKAKETGATVIMGGQHSSTLAKNILKNRPFVDYVVTGDGEEALLGLVNGNPLQAIPNLYSRQFGNHGKAFIDLNALPTLNFNSIDTKLYFSNFQAKFGHWGYKKALPIYSHKGCPWQEKTGGCIFCRRHDGPVKVLEPKLFWKQVLYLQNSYDIDIIWDVADTITMDSEWLRDIVKHKPQGCQVKFLVYSRLDDINPQTVTLLSKLGCHEVMVGVEAANEDLLNSSGKGTRTTDCLNAAKLLTDQGIFVFPTFIIGLPGETTDTIRQTRELVQSMIENYNISQIACTPLIPIPGSPAMEMLSKISEKQSQYLETDFFDVRELIIDWLSHFTNIKLEQLLSALNSILALHIISSSFGKDLAI